MVRRVSLATSFRSDAICLLILLGFRHLNFKKPIMSRTSVSLSLRSVDQLGAIAAHLALPVNGALLACIESGAVSRAGLAVLILAPTVQAHPLVCSAEALARLDRIAAAVMPILQDRPPFNHRGRPNRSRAMAALIATAFSALPIPSPSAATSPEPV